MKHLRTLAYLLLAASLTACGSKEQKEEENEVGRKKYEIEKNPVDTIVLRKQYFTYAGWPTLRFNPPSRYFSFPSATYS